MAMRYTLWGQTGALDEALKGAGSAKPCADRKYWRQPLPFGFLLAPVFLTRSSKERDTTNCGEETRPQLRRRQVIHNRASLALMGGSARS